MADNPPPAELILALKVGNFFRLLAAAEFTTEAGAKLDFSNSLLTLPPGTLPEVFKPGAAGLVPDPGNAGATKFLNAAGTFTVPPGTGGSGGSGGGGGDATGGAMSGPWNTSAGVPALAGFTTIDPAGCATFTEDEGRAINLKITGAPPSGPNLVGFSRPVPGNGGAYSIAIFAGIFAKIENYAGFAWGWRDSVSGKLHILVAALYAGNQQFEPQTYNSPSNRNSGSGLIGTPRPSNLAPGWFHLNDDGAGNASFGWSDDGLNQNIISTFAKSGGWLGSSGYNQVFAGFFPDTEAGTNFTGQGITIYCYDEQGLTRLCSGFNPATGGGTPAPVVLTYQSDGDANGVFYYLGTARGASAWVNPITGGQVIASSSGALAAGSYASLVDRQPSDVYFGLTGDSAYTFDLGASHALEVSKWSYRSRSGATSSTPTALTLQGSADGNAWTNLDVRSGLDFSGATSTWASFDVSGQSVAYRFLRVQQVGNDSSASGYYTAGEFEFYGTLS